MSQYKLIYFNAMGLGELPRYIFAYAGQDYEDYRFKDEGWPIVKTTTPFGQVPILEVNYGNHIEQIAQSSTIARYLYFNKIKFRVL